MHDWMLNTLNKGPKVVERLLRVFPTDRLDDRIDKDRFTAREVVAHLADYEQVVLDRIRVANLKPGHNVPDYDPDAQCREHHFFDKEIFHEAEVFESRREMTHAYLMDLKEEDWEKTFNKNGEQLSILQYVGRVLAHDVEHIEQLSVYLATEVATIL
jgi:hypothetical protein